MRAYLDCWRNGYATKVLIELLKGRSIPPELTLAAAHIKQAHAMNPDLVNHFLQKGILAPSGFTRPKSSDASNVFRIDTFQNQRAAAADTLELSAVEEDGVVAVHGAIETANACSHLENALNALDPFDETRRSAYARLMPAIEQCYSLEYFPFPIPDELKELLTILVGERRT